MPVMKIPATPSPFPCRNPDPSVTIPGHAFKEMSPTFRSQWSREKEEQKVKLIKSIADRAHPDDMDTIPPHAPDWKRAAAQPSCRQPAQYKANSASTVSPDTLLDFLNDKELHTEANFCEYQAAAAKAFSSAADDAGGGDTFIFEESSRDVNAASTKGTKAK